MFHGAMRQWIQTGRESQVFTKYPTCGLERSASSQLFLSVVCYRLFQGWFYRFLKEKNVFRLRPKRLKEGVLHPFVEKRYRGAQYIPKNEDEEVKTQKTEKI